MRRPLIAVSTALAAALIAAGCTAARSNDAAEDFQGAEQDVAQVIDDLSSAAVDGDASAVCDTIFSQELSDALGPQGANCEDAVEEQLGDVSDPEIEVKGITVEGSTATAEVVSPFGGDDVEQTISFARDGEAWRITSVEPEGPAPEPDS